MYSIVLIDVFVHIFPLTFMFYFQEVKKSYASPRIFFQEDLKDWTIDVLTDAFARVEESVRHGSK